MRHCSFQIVMNIILGLSDEKKPVGALWSEHVVRLPTVRCCGLWPLYCGDQLFFISIDFVVRNSPLGITYKHSEHRKLIKIRVVFRTITKAVMF